MVPSPLNLHLPTSILFSFFSIHPTSTKSPLKDFEMSSSIQDPSEFLQSFQASGGWYDAEYFSFAEFGGMGWGGRAVKDIPVRPTSRYLDIRRVMSVLLVESPEIRLKNRSIHPFFIFPSPRSSPPTPLISARGFPRQNGRV